MKFLARLKIKSNSPDVLGALAQTVHASYDAAKLNQDHYSVEGSMDEHCAKLNAAFRKWCDGKEEATCYEFGWWY